MPVLSCGVALCHPCAILLYRRTPRSLHRVRWSGWSGAFAAGGNGDKILRQGEGGSQELGTPVFSERPAPPDQDVRTSHFTDLYIPLGPRVAEELFIGYNDVLGSFEGIRVKVRRSGAPGRRSTITRTPQSTGRVARAVLEARICRNFVRSALPWAIDRTGSRGFLRPFLPDVAYAVGAVDVSRELY